MRWQADAVHPQASKRTGSAGLSLLRHSREMTRVCSRKVTRGRDDTNTRFAAFAVRQIPRRRFDRSATANHLLGMRGLHAFGVDDNAAHTLALRQSCSYCGSLLLSTNGSFLASADAQFATLMFKCVRDAAS